MWKYSNFNKVPLKEDIKNPRDCPSHKEIYHMHEYTWDMKRLIRGIIGFNTFIGFKNVFYASEVLKILCLHKIFSFQAEAPAKVATLNVHYQKSSSQQC